VPSQIDLIKIVVEKLEIKRRVYIRWIEVDERLMHWVSVDDRTAIWNEGVLHGNLGYNVGMVI